MNKEDLKLLLSVFKEIIEKTEKACKEIEKMPKRKQNECYIMSPEIRLFEIMMSKYEWSESKLEEVWNYALSKEYIHKNYLN